MGLFNQVILLILKDVTNCREKNGGCDQICREDQRGLLCSCQYGSVLDGDGHTCNGKYLIHNL